MKFVHLIGLTVYSKIIKNKERLTQMQTSKHLNKPYSALVNHIVDYYRIVTEKRLMIVAPYIVFFSLTKGKHICRE